MSLNRRRVLSAVTAAAGAGVLAGCAGDGSATGSESDATTARASFFVFGDVAGQVAGSAAESALLVPVGQHGHGWEPGPRVREQIRDADLFVHGMAGFQPWVDDIRTDLEADGSGVTTVDASADVDLLEAGTDHDHSDDEEHADDHHDDGEDDHHDGGEDEHDQHGAGMDPHFWTDPLRVKRAVDTVRRGFADVDPDNADAYAENAAAFRSDLDDLHARIETTVSDASKDTILVAGHDSFQYFGDRYGVTVESLTNVSPDDRPTPRDIERAQSVIQTHDLEYICADPLESQQAADQLVAETDATAVLPLTAMPGLTDEWEKKEWGYLAVMENVNLPTLERTLDA
ncbi:MAG: ABC-type metal ion transport system, periplasmic component/surface adhesin [uncultured archaeon A07HR67]|nr:MAG: ABC-type metal ion transport system, periplasmic component/surface adhesin [uncultured archaeon A07HR67]